MNSSRFQKGEAPGTRPGLKPVHPFACECRLNPCNEYFHEIVLARGRTALVEKSVTEHDPNDQRRAFPRWSVALNGTCRGRWGSSRCLITEMNEAGMGLVSGHHHRVGDEMTVTCRLENSEEPLEINCVVRHATTKGTGVAFLNITASKRVRVLAFIKKRQAARDATHH